MNFEIPVVITGVGLVTPIGLDRDSFWNSLVNRQSGVMVRPEFQDVRHPFRIAAEVTEFEPKKYVRPRKSLKVMCRPIQFGFAASTFALEDAGLEQQIDPDRLSTVYGTEAFYADPHEVARVFRKCIVNRCYDHDRWGQYAIREIEPLWMLKYLPNMVASHISIACDARGPSNTICQAEASSLLAIIEAIDLIQRDAADAVIAGGTGSLMATTGMIYRGLHRLSHRIDEPELASRPFDVQRDGMVVGEGAAAFVIEREDRARARGATPLATVIGYDRAFYPPGENFSEGIARSLESAMQRSGVAPADISHVNANAFSTIEDDVQEARGIQKVLNSCPVIAPKSTFGNLGPGTGAIELAASIEACRRGTLPPVMNLQQQDDRCPIHVVVEDHVDCSSNIAISCNFTAHGQIASLVISV